MMAFANLEDIIPKILKVVNFEEYLIHEGYSFMPNKKINGFEAFAKKNEIVEDEIIFVGFNKEDNSEIYYSMLFNDYGNIIDFVKNRIEFDNTYETFEPMQDTLIEACKKLVEYIHIKGENQNKIQLETSEDDFNSLKNQTFSIYYKAKSLYDFDYLNHYKISQETVNHPLFKETLFNTVGLVNTSQKFDFDTVNMAYPLINENNKECGLLFQNLIRTNTKQLENISFFAPGSIKTGLWISNKIAISNKTKTKITIVSNPVEALSHFSYLKENRLYVAVFDTDETTYSHIISLINQSPLSILHLAGEVSVPNFIEEIKIIIKAINNKKQNPMLSFEKEHYNHIIINLNTKEIEEKNIENFMNRIKRNNAAKLLQIIKILGEEAKKHIKEDLIIPALDMNSNIVLKIPKNMKTLYSLQQFLIKSFAKNKIIIEKPMYFSWNKQLHYFNEIISSTPEEEEGLIQKYIDEEKIFIFSN